MHGGHVIYVGRVDFRNDNRLFGIKHEDRFSHVYVIGKTGTGKSTLLKEIANSLRNETVRTFLLNEFERFSFGYRADGTAPIQTRSERSWQIPCSIGY